jgi:hypothetical protein
MTSPDSQMIVVTIAIVAIVAMIAIVLLDLQLL